LKYKIKIILRIRIGIGMKKMGEKKGKACRAVGVRGK
jgi:hypothetical protein